MNLRQIEVFHAVFMHGSVSGAARALGVSQPSVTKVLRHAERTLGFALFDRVKGRLSPTQNARTIFGEVSDIQDRVRSLRLACQNLKRGEGGLLRIAALPSLGLAAIPDAVAAFTSPDRDVTFDLQTLHHEDMVRKLYEREADIAIGFALPPAAPVVHRVIGEGELVALFHPDRIPDAPARLRLEDLRGSRIISPLESGPIGHLLAAELTRLDIELEEAASSRTYYIAAGLARAGMGVAIVDNFTAVSPLAAGLANRPLSPAVTFDIHAMHLQNRPPSRLANDFLDTLADVMEAL